MGVACPTCAACHPAVPPTPVRLRLWQGHCLVLVVSHLSQGHRWSRLPPVCSVAGLKPLCLSCTKGLHTLFDCHRRPIAACCIFPSLHGHWHTCSSKRKTYKTVHTSLLVPMPWSLRKEPTNPGAAPRDFIPANLPRSLRNALVLHKCNRQTPAGEQRDRKMRAPGKSPMPPIPSSCPQTAS
jgi:hypothetical protein